MNRLKSNKFIISLSILILLILGWNFNVLALEHQAIELTWDTRICDDQGQKLVDNVGSEHLPSYTVYYKYWGVIGHYENGVPKYGWLNSQKTYTEGKVTNTYKLAGSGSYSSYIKNSASCRKAAYMLWHNPGRSSVDDAASNPVQIWWWNGGASIGHTCSNKKNTEPVPSFLKNNFQKASAIKSEQMNSIATLAVGKAEDNTNNEVETEENGEDSVTEVKSNGINTSTISLGASSSSISGDADKYLEITKDPWIENMYELEGEKSSYNDIIGPLKIDYEPTGEWLDKINVSKSFYNKNAKTYLSGVAILYKDGTYIEIKTERPENDDFGVSPDKRTISNPDGIKIKQNGNEFENPNEIDRNIDFYIVNPYIDKEVKSIGIKIEKKVMVYVASLQKHAGSEAEAKEILEKFKAEHPDCIITSHTKIEKPQDLIIIAKATNVDYAYNDIELPVKIKKGDIELTKKGIYKDEKSEEQKEEPLPNVKFKVYCNEIGKYIESVEPWDENVPDDEKSYKITFTEDIDKAKIYETQIDEDGTAKVLIQHLYAGKDTDVENTGGCYSYKLIEVDGGDNSYYIDPLKIESGVSTHSGEILDPDITTGHLEIGDKKCCTIENVTVYYDDNGGTSGKGQRIKTYILIEDDRTSADLLIEKVDETFPDDVKLEGAEFKVKLVRSEHLNEDGEEDPDHDLGITNEWIKKGVAIVSVEEDGTRVYDYSKLLHDEYLVSDESQAEIFVTGRNGRIKILCVINGEYQIYETKTSLGYDITRQWEYGTDTDHEEWVDYGTTVISTDDNHKENRLTNRKAVKIEGNVWEDLQVPSKDAEKYFSLKNPNAKPGSENYKQIDESIQVNLWLKESKLDKIISTSERKLDGSFKDGLEVKDGFVKVAYTMTDQGTGSWEINRFKQAGPNNGEKELIEDIYYWDLTDAYIEFVYNNQTYICADPFAMMTDTDMKRANNVSDERQISVENNSKAIEYELDRDELDDTNLTGTVAPKPGSAVTKLNATYGANSDVEMAPTDILSYNWYATDANGNYLVDNLDKLGLTGYYNPNPGHYSVEHINLALWRKDKPEYQIQETLRYSKILMNGYTYTYDYYNGDAEVGVKSDFVPTTNQQVADKVYGAKIYPSDVAYTATDANRENDKTIDDGMEMYVVYKIDITNNEVRSPVFRRNIYDEVRLYVTELTNTFNKEMYTLDSTQHTDSDDWEGSEYFDLWSNQGDGLAKYNIKADETGVTKEGSDQLSDGIPPNGEKGSNGTETVYIQFKVNQEFLNAVLSGKLEGYNNGLAISEAHAKAHHAYTREDNVWTYANSEYMSDNSSNIYDPTKNVPVEYAIDGTQNSRREDRTDTGNRTTSEGKRHTFLHRTKDEPRDSGALGLLFELGAERTIEGTVYEDFDMRNDEENKGNGIIDEDENNVGTDVKVELIDNSTGKNATLYQKDNNESGHREVPNATVTTTENGRYSFVGVVPGIYRLKFTYSDGTTKIKEADGNMVDFTSNDYKSTIINTSAEEGAGEYIREAEEYTESQTGKDNTNMLGKIEASALRENSKLKEQLEWYKYVYNKDGAPRYNVTTDDFGIRCNFENYEYEADKATDNYPPIMNSYTPFFSISVENDIQDKRSVEDKAYTEENDYELGHRNIYEEFNFGVIKTTKTDITLDKIISDVKLTTSSGTTLFQGSPRDALNYVTALDNLREGSKYVRVEMPLDNIYGTALETTYKITISNNYIGNNKDYIENAESENFGQYFKYGNKTADAHLVKTTVTEAVDSMDPDYDLLNNILVEKIHHPKEAEVDGTIVSEEKGLDKEDTVTVTPKEGNLVLTEWDPIEVGGTTQVEYMASGIFRDDMDLTYNNNARITKIKLDKTQALKTNYTTWSNPIDTRLIITPDTGEDRSSTYIITGIVALIVLAAGIVVIKGIFTKKED